VFTIEHKDTLNEVAEESSRYEDSIMTGIKDTNQTVTKEVDETIDEQVNAKFRGRFEAIKLGRASEANEESV
jgi:hypothetical protein